MWGKGGDKRLKEIMKLGFSEGGFRENKILIIAKAKRLNK